LATRLALASSCAGSILNSAIMVSWISGAALFAVAT
jgi:hypothetical protein